MTFRNTAIRRIAPFVAAACAGATATTATWAATDGDAAILEEIVVTALKRDSSLVDTPAAISVVSGDRLGELQIDDLTDLSSSIPNLQIGQAAGVSYVTLRGVSLDSIVGGVEGATAIHLDGVYLSQATRMDFLFMDAESVEVLRGPQGTLYGRNATAGTINVTPARPTSSFGGDASFSYSNYDTFQARGAVSGPLGTDKLLGRVAVLGGKRSDGYARNIVTGTKLGTNEQWGARGTLRFLPTDDITVDLSAFTYYDRNSEAFQVARTPVGAEQAFFNPSFANHVVSFDPRRPAFNTDPVVREQHQGALLTAHWVLSPQFSIKSNTSYTDLKDSHFGIDCDGSAIPACTANAIQQSRSFQEELNLKMSLLDERLDWIVGAFYDKDRAHHRQSFPFANGISLQGFLIPDNTAFSEYSVQDTESVAGFTDAIFNLTDLLTIYGGLRWSRDEREMVLSSGLENTVTRQFFAGCTNNEQKVEYTNTSEKAGLQVHFSPRSQLYVQWQSGFKAGGFNAAECGGSFEPENITSYEVGYKLQAFDGRLNLALTGFHYDYENVQIGQQVGLAYRVVNVPKTKIDGLEIESTVRLFGRAQLDGQVSFLDARFDDFTSFDPLDVGAPAQVLDGNRLNRAPRSSGTVGLQSSWTAFKGGDITLRGEVVFSSRYYYRPFNQAQDMQKEYTTGNAFLTYQPGGSELQIRAFVRNIADTTILSAIFSQDFVQNLQGQYQQPRTYGIEVFYKL